VIRALRPGIETRVTDVSRGVAVTVAVNRSRAMVLSLRNPHHYRIGAVAERSNAAVLKTMAAIALE